MAKMTIEEKRKKNNEYMRRWYAANRERLRAKDQERLKDPEEAEKNRARARAWAKKNKPRVLANAKAWYLANRERALATNRRRYKNKREQILAWNKKWYEKNKARASVCNRKARLLQEFGITVEQYEELRVKQGGVCAICKKSPGKLRLAVDHDHVTNTIRGLLCGSCNRGLGMFRDSVANLQSAIEYLRQAEELLHALKRVG